MGIVIYAAWVVAIFVTFLFFCIFIAFILCCVDKGKNQGPLFHDERVEEYLDELGCRLDFICDVLAETPAGKRVIAEHPELLEELKEDLDKELLAFMSEDLERNCEVKKNEFLE